MNRVERARSSVSIYSRIAFDESFSGYASGLFRRCIPTRTIRGFSHLVVLMTLTANRVNAYFCSTWNSPSTWNEFYWINLLRVKLLRKREYLLRHALRGDLAILFFDLDSDCFATQIFGGS